MARNAGPQPKGAVWAYRRELDEWLGRRRPGPIEDAAVPAARFKALFPVAGLVAVAAGPVAFRPVPKPIPAPVGELRAVPLTAYPGIEREPAWSPDGGTIAFSWASGDGNAAIYTLRVGDGTPKRLTADSLAESSPTWAPDGEKLAFLRGSGRLRRLVIRELRDGRETVLAEVTANRAAWTANGKSIIIGGGEYPGPELGEVPVATGELSTLDLGAGALWPAPMPDGGFLFGRLHSSAWVDPWIAPAEGKPRALVQGLRIDGAPALSPDGETVVFAGDPTGRPVLHRVPVSGGTPVALSGLGDNVFHPAMARSPDGRTQLVYERRIHGLDIVALDLASGKESLFAGGGRSETNPQFSPDGKRFAFSSDRSGNWEIWTARADGSEPKQLTRLGRRRCGVPRYSPDGKWVAFDSALPDTDYDVFVVGADGGQVRQITNGAGEDGRPSWSRDGKFLYFFSERTGQRQIWNMAFPDGTPVQITRNGGYEGFESLDGKYLYYTVDEERAGLRRVPVNGGAEEEVSDRVRQGYWAVTAKGIYYLVWGAAATGLTVKLLAPESKTDRAVATLLRRIFRPAPGFAITPDGERAVISVVAESESDLMLVPDFK